MVVSAGIISQGLKVFSFIQGRESPGLLLTKCQALRGVLCLVPQTAQHWELKKMLGSLLSEAMVAQGVP